MGNQRTRLPSLTSFDAIKEALDVRLGRRGDKRDAAVTFRDLEESGAFRLVNRGGTSGLQQQEPSNVADMPEWFGGGVDLGTWVPEAPTGFVATPMFDGIFLDWDWPPLFGAVGYTEIYRATTNDAASREFLTLVDGLTFVDQIDGEDEQEYFYWIRFRSLGDKVGPFAGPVSAVSVPQVEQLIERLEGEVDETLLAQHLRERIDLIDGEGGLVEQVQDQGETFARQITQVQTRLGSEVSALQQTMQSQYNETTGRIESIYSIRINSNGRISGFGLADDGNESVFGVEADRFYVGYDRPFFISGGRTYIKRAAIGRAIVDDITADVLAATDAKIENLSVDYGQITNVRVNSADIVNGAIRTAKIADASINTLKVAGRSIVVTEYADRGYSLNLRAGISRKGFIEKRMSHPGYYDGGTGVVIVASINAKCYGGSGEIQPKVLCSNGRTLRSGSYKVFSGTQLSYSVVFMDSYPDRYPSYILAFDNWGPDDVTINGAHMVLYSGKR